MYLDELDYEILAAVDKFGGQEVSYSKLSTIFPNQNIIYALKKLSKLQYQTEPLTGLKVTYSNSAYLNEKIKALPGDTILEDTVYSITPRGKAALQQYKNRLHRARISHKFHQQKLRRSNLKYAIIGAVISLIFSKFVDVIEWLLS